MQDQQACLWGLRGRSRIIPWGIFLPRIIFTKVYLISQTFQEYHYRQPVWKWPLTKEDRWLIGVIDTSRITVLTDCHKRSGCLGAGKAADTKIEKRRKQTYIIFYRVGHQSFFGTHKTVCVEWKCRRRTLCDSWGKVWEGRRSTNEKWHSIQSNLQQIFNSHHSGLQTSWQNSFKTVVNIFSTCALLYLFLLLPPLNTLLWVVDGSHSY